jgi:hypothetical protein
MDDTRRSKENRLRPATIKRDQRLVFAHQYCQLRPLTIAADWRVPGFRHGAGPR